MDMSIVVTVYEKYYRELRNMNNAKESHIYAMRRLREICPDTKAVTFEENQLFASTIGNVKKKIERDYVNQAETTQLKRSAYSSRMDLFRAMAQTGFIADAKHLNPLIGDDSARQTSAYIGFLRNEGWDCARVDYGWITNNKNGDVLCEIEELEKQIDELKKRLLNDEKGE